jgi:ribosomal protein L16 Arg81 hydroxylase
MQLTPVETVENITQEDFVKNYYLPQKPVLLKGLTKEWNQKWTFDHIKHLAGDQTVPLYSNARTKGKKSTYEPVTEMNFGDYLDIMRSGPTDLRISSIL